MKKSLLLSEEKPNLSELLNELPPFVTRTFPRFQELTGYSARTLANFDSKGEGPSERILMGRTVAYPRQALVAWLEARSKVFT
jgi:predicted DNA-binding transcriptional regulator AlpA